MPSVALGVKVFSRVSKLSELLNSIPKGIFDTVYVADDGESDPQKKELYSNNHDYDLIILDLEYDSGLGFGRRRIIEEMDEEYLLIVDSDHEVPDNVDVLINQMESSPEFGGIAGLWLEDGSLVGGCHDLFEEGKVLIRDIRDGKEASIIEGHPIIPFEFVPNTAIFRSACLDSYAWDEEYIIGSEHLDFYVGHKRHTDWKFGVCPSVLFPHKPGGDSSYLQNRQSAAKNMDSKSYFLEKWGYEQVVWNDVFPPQYQHRQVLLNQYLLSSTKSKALVQSFLDAVQNIRGFFA
ncbi:glycosyltransferase family 2 protein [Halorarum halobium]|uniref:glycosyltransferase family 2 protein n=1 Tax=Halorarum halobium TaxID=3075121 RepID=UPI0028ABACC0|nr:glycosyltransferase [Halobaculum sp. XH14]